MRVVCGRLEDLDATQLGLVGKVDVLVSEWMGYGLLFETMLDSVLVARDRYADCCRANVVCRCCVLLVHTMFTMFKICRFLRPGGAVLPDVATMYVAAAAVPVPNEGFWGDVYGFDMSFLGQQMAQQWKGRANLATLATAQLATAPVPLQRFDIATMKVEDADFSTTVILRVSKVRAAWCWRVAKHMWLQTLVLILTILTAANDGDCAGGVV